MRLALGAPVKSADGDAVGTVDQLILDATTREVVNFVLRTGRFATHDYIVPLAAITREDDDNTIHLRLTAVQVRTLPEFVSENFVLAAHSEETLWRYLIPTPLGGAVVPAVPKGPVIEGVHVFDPDSNSMFAVKDSTDLVMETRSSLPEFDFRQGKGTKVVTRDDHVIGTLRELEIDANGKPKAIVVATGPLHRHHLTIPIAYVRSADSKQIYVNLTKGEFERVVAAPSHGESARSGAHA